MRAGQELILLCLHSRHPRTNSSWIYSRPHTRHPPPPPPPSSFHSTPVAAFIPDYNLHYKLCSKLPCIWRKSSSLQEQIRLQTSFLSMPADSQVVLQFSVVLTSFPPAEEREQGRKEERPTTSPPSLPCQAACASIGSSSSSSSSSSLQQTHHQDQDGGRGKEGMERSDGGKEEKEGGVDQWEEKGGVGQGTNPSSQSGGGASGRSHRCRTATVSS